MKKVLIVSYLLSTRKGVGGRRWLKFANQLSKDGYQVSVLTAQNHFDPEELDPSIECHFFKANYPSVLDQYPESIWDKIRYRFAVFFLSIVVNGTIYDVGSRLGDVTKKRVRAILESSNYPSVIVSGAPFSFLYFMAELKAENPSVNLICDFRDPWTWGKGYGMRSISGRRMLIEKNRESLVFQKADYITSASYDVKEYIDAKLTLAGQTEKSLLLMNGIESRVSKLIQKRTNRDGIILTHIGTIGNETSKYWKRFLDYLEFSTSKIEVRIYGNSNREFIDEVTRRKMTEVFFFDRVPEQDLEHILLEADALLMFKRDELPNSFASKFFDYIKSRRPIIVYTLDGLVSEEIIRNNIGYVFTDNTPLEEVDIILSGIDNDPNFNDEYDWSKYTIEKLAKKLHRILV
ncbi:MAG: hypothetical protein R2813_03040 [Flavobacteriales bacterium]